MLLKFTTKKSTQILALGAESAGNFSVFCDGKIYLSPDFGDLLEEKNWKKFQKAVLQYLKDNKIKPAIILSDLHPLFKTTTWGEKLSKKFGAKFVQVQHHHAHIFSAVGDKIINSKSYQLEAKSYALALDGTGLGMGEKIWGGEAFVISNFQFPISNKNSKLNIERIGHLENQTLIGGEMAIQEPTRVLIAILAKIKSQKSKVKNETQNLKLEKDFIFKQIKKYYSKNDFELLWNQLKQNFNCVETSSAGRVLDAVSLILGFCKNERKYKHEPIDLLEKNSTVPYSNLKPKIDVSKNNHTLNTTYLFEYLIKNIKKDKKRLAATAQLYIAEGLYEIIKLKTKSYGLKAIFVSGGLANNKIISDYFNSGNVHLSKKIPRGDAGISFGQIVYYLLQK